MSRIHELHTACKQALADGAEMVIGWRESHDPARCAPHFAKTAEDCDALVLGPGCVQNLAGYLTAHRGRKVAVVVKGCDSRTVAQLLSEGLVDREELTVIGAPCGGVLDRARVRAAAAGRAVTGVTVDEAAGTATIATAGGEVEAPLDELLAPRCLRCRFPNPVLCDTTVGETREPRVADGAADSELDAFLEQSVEDRFRHWEAELGRCVRCYACRNACPLCVCQDHCLAETRRPGWLSQGSSVRDKLLFQVIHAMHTAGRCTECGECERACPMDIPVLLMKRMLNREAEALFGHVAGTDPAGVAPLLTFQAEEDNIPEKD